MRKTTIYTLLCTTMTISSPSLAMNEAQDTPIKAKFTKLKKEFLQTLPTTPIIEKEVEKKIRRDILSPDTADYYYKQGVEREKSIRNMERDKEFSQISQKEFQERMKRASELSEKQAEKQENAHQKLIEEAKRATAIKNEANEALQLKISELSVGITGNVKEIETLKEKYLITRQFSKENAEQMKIELDAKIKLLDEKAAELEGAKMDAATLKLQLAISREGEKRLKKGLKEIALQQVSDKKALEKESESSEEEIKAPEKEIKVPEKESESSEEERADGGL